MDEKDGEGRGTVEADTKHGVGAVGVDPRTKVMRQEREQETREPGCRGEEGGERNCEITGHMGRSECVW